MMAPGAEVSDFLRVALPATADPRKNDQKKALDGQNGAFFSPQTSAPGAARQDHGPKSASKIRRLEAYKSK